MKAVLIRHYNDDDFAAEVKSKLDVIEFTDIVPAKIVAKKLGIPIITLVNDGLEDYNGLVLTPDYIQYRTQNLLSIRHNTGGFAVLGMNNITNDIARYLKAYCMPYMTADEYEICKAVGDGSRLRYIGPDIPTSHYNEIVIQKDVESFNIDDQKYYQRDGPNKYLPSGYFLYLPIRHKFILLNSDSVFDAKFDMPDRGRFVDIDQAKKVARIGNMPVVMKKYDKKFDDFENFVITEDAIYLKGDGVGSTVYVSIGGHPVENSDGQRIPTISWYIYEICKKACLEFNFEYVRMDSTDPIHHEFDVIHTYNQIVINGYKLIGSRFSYYYTHIRKEHDKQENTVKNGPIIKDFGFCKVVNKKTLIWSNNISITISSVAALNEHFIDLLEELGNGRDFEGHIGDELYIMSFRHDDANHIKFVKKITKDVSCFITMSMKQFMNIRDYLV